MDKETLSNYGWIVICVMVIAVMIALASPFGTFVSNAVKSTTQGLFGANQKALNSTGLINMEDQWFDGFEMLDVTEVYTKGSTDVLTFRSSAPVSEFKEVRVDNEVVDPSNYTVTEGSTIITFTPEYSEQLKLGNHTIAIVSGQSGAKADFIVVEKHGLHYGEAYIGTMDGATVKAIFNEDTSAQLYINGNLEADIPAGFITYTKETVDMTAIGYGTGVISADGKTIDIGGLVLTLTPPAVTNSSLPCYIVITEDWEIGEIVDVKVYEECPQYAIDIIKNQTNDDLVQTTLGYITNDYIYSYFYIHNENLYDGWCATGITTKEFVEEIAQLTSITLNAQNAKYASQITKCPELLSYIDGMPMTGIRLGGVEFAEQITVAPIIPSTVKWMDEAFCGFGFEVAPEIPSNVTMIFAAFRDCKNLKTSPAIPATVERMDDCFQFCTSLTGELEINAQLDYKYVGACFGNVDFEKQQLILKGTCTEIDDMGNSGINYCAECNGKCANNH